ncbi:glycosyltransferase family 4 protein [Geomonas oryzisoli]|uniref:Glycosyltransferase family 4 protein n=1 Tax=Geomonas oryzisoli TaxID=2847992 RepID=A0ABX8J120_9BACT|nr:glycosyltransferase family 4 protein [Geomonas oryzisoli]QWV91848.1 glycosyltransferase family 4 protein [Geomonas oryzisoli]
MAAVDSLPAVASKGGRNGRCNLLFLHYGDDAMRGSEISLLKIMYGLDRERFGLFAICNRERYRQALEAAGVTARCAEIPEVMVDGRYLRLQVASFFRTVFSLARYIKRNDIRLVYCNNGLPSQAGYYAAKLAGVPIVSHVRSPYNLRYILLYRMNRVTARVFVSRAIRDEFCGKVRPKGLSTVIYNSVDTERFTPARQRDGGERAELGIPADRIVLGQVGSLIYRKGIDVVLEALALARESNAALHLVLAGSGADEPAFRRAAETMGVQRAVTFLGEVAEPLALYQQVFDINLLASRREAFGVSLIEGASCGLPAIGSRVDGIPEIIDDNSSGILVPPGDAAALAQAMLTLAADRSLRERMGAAGRQIVLSRFSLDRYVASVGAVIEDILAG